MGGDDLRRAQDCALAMVASERPLRDILGYLAREAEAASDGRCVCSVLRNGASPSLPADYLDGMQAAWSVPIVATNGRVLGTFGTYYRELREPSPEERSAVEGLAEVARMVIELD